MKFTLTARHEYFWPVEVFLPSPDKAGEVISQTFEMKFVAMTKDETLANEAEFRGLTTVEARSVHETMHLKRVCCGWNEDVVDELDEPIPFSEAALDAALQTSWFRNAVWIAYAASLAAGPRLGN